MVSLINQKVNRGAGLEIEYANVKLKKYFNDYGLMQKTIPLDWVKKIKKMIQWLKAADNFGVFLKLGLGKPEPLKGYGEKVVYSLHISANTRFVFQLNADIDTVLICSGIVVKGVCDYHGGKENWYLS